MLDVIAFVGCARQLGLTLAEIAQIVGLRRTGRTPCVHVRAVLQQKVKSLESLRRESATRSAPGIR